MSKEEQPRPHERSIVLRYRVQKALRPQGQRDLLAAKLQRPELIWGESIEEVEENTEKIKQAYIQARKEDGDLN